MSALNRSWLLVTIPFVLVAGCPKPEAKEEAKDAAPPAVSAASSAEPTVNLVERDASVNLMEVTSDVKSRKDPRYKQVPLFEKLAIERSDHPKDAMHADDFFDALQKQGVEVSRRRQVLALTVGAGYCAKADAEPDVDVTVCEFDDEASLAKGKKAIMSVPYPDRSLYSRKLSTVGVGKIGTTPATAETAKKIVEILNKM